MVWLDHVHVKYDDCLIDELLFKLCDLKHSLYLVKSSDAHYLSEDGMLESGLFYFPHSDDSY